MGSARNRFSSRASCPAKLSVFVFQLAQTYGNTYDSGSFLCRLACIRIFEVFQIFLVTSSDGVPSSNGVPSGFLSIIDVGVADSLAVHSGRVLDVCHVKYCHQSKWKSVETRKGKKLRGQTAGLSAVGSGHGSTSYTISSATGPKAASELKYPRRPPRTSGVHVVPRIGYFAAESYCKEREWASRRARQSAVQRG